MPVPVSNPLNFNFNLELSLTRNGGVVHLGLQRQGPGTRYYPFSRSRVAMFVAWGEGGRRRRWHAIVTAACASLHVC